LLGECGRPSTVIASTDTSLKIEPFELVEEDRWGGRGRSAKTAGTMEVRDAVREVGVWESIVCTRARLARRTRIREEALL
jgi:hypothetical protein